MIKNKPVTREEIVLQKINKHTEKLLVPNRKKYILIIVQGEAAYVHMADQIFGVTFPLQSHKRVIVTLLPLKDFKVHSCFCKA